MIVTILLWIVGAYLFIGFLLGANMLRKTDTKTNLSQKAAVLLAGILAWGYFFVLGIKRATRKK